MSVKEKNHDLFDCFASKHMQLLNFKGWSSGPRQKKKIAANIGFQKKKKESNISDMICKDVSNNINMIYQPAASKNLKLSK